MTARIEEVIPNNLKLYKHAGEKGSFQESVNLSKGLMVFSNLLLKFKQCPLVFHQNKRGNKVIFSFGNFVKNFIVKDYSPGRKLEGITSEFYKYKTYKKGKFTNNVEGGIK